MQRRQDKHAEAEDNEERDPDQAWYWTPEWQKAEHEAEEEIKAGHVNSKRFMKSFAAIPKPFQQKAQKAFSLFVANLTYPYHPSLYVKKIKGLSEDVWEAPVGQFYQFTFHYEKETDPAKRSAYFATLDGTTLSIMPRNEPPVAQTISVNVPIQLVGT